MIDLHFATFSNDGMTPTPCPRCGDASRVRPVIVRGVDRRVRYWGCERCGCVWGVVSGSLE
jgi:hypothetical protein